MGKKKPPTPKETTRDSNNTFPQTNKQKKRASLVSSPHKDQTTKEYLNTNPTTKTAEKSHCNNPNHHNSSIIHKNLKEKQRHQAHPTPPRKTRRRCVTRGNKDKQNTHTRTHAHTKRHSTENKT
jgi:hypothetical protein